MFTNPSSSQPSRRARRTALAGAVGATALLALTACGPEDGVGVTVAVTAGATQGGATPAAPATAAPATGAPAQPAPTKAAPGGAAPKPGGAATAGGKNADAAAGGAPACTPDDLKVSAYDNTIDQVNGVVTVQLDFRGSHECKLFGFPGVDLKVGGTTMAVQRTNETPYGTVLKSGMTAAFHITYPVNNSGGSGVKASQIVITPPNDTHQVTVPWPGGSFGLDNPEKPDGNGKVLVGPVGEVSGSPAG
ncbi:DUF4232 domain-containing protein [Kitasatospora sp. NPDC056651]|uniref:DUF4232 domain-containing protein n=1 Tax=Kitasatospora sp. NPDC056651 TaxID=3345892 RepID=UPI00369186A6